MSTSKRERLAVFLGIFGAWLLSAAFVGWGFVLFGRTAFAQSLKPLQSCGLAVSIAAIAMVLGIGWAARTRHFVSNIDGSKPIEGSGLDITLRYVSKSLTEK